MGLTVDDKFPGSLLIDEEKNQKITTKFNGQAGSVTLVANRTVNQMTRLDTVRHFQRNQRAGGLPLMWGVRREYIDIYCIVMYSYIELKMFCQEDASCLKR